MKVAFLWAGQQFYSLSLRKNNIYGQTHFELILTHVQSHQKKLLNNTKMVSQGIKNSIVQKWHREHPDQVNGDYWLPDDI